jgi:predicted transposase YbfD/YdcC
MQTHPTASIIEHFSSIPDPRINRRKLHKLGDIFFITLCAVICGADDWVSIEMFGKAKEAWFTEVLGLEHGIPSHDTFGHVFAVINTQEFNICFSRWASDLAGLSGGEIIAIDGKCLRRSMDTASQKAAIYMVSAWATQNQLVLGQQKVDDKSNEITAIPKLLMQLNITGGSGDNGCNGLPNQGGRTNHRARGGLYAQSEGQPRQLAQRCKAVF